MNTCVTYGLRVLTLYIYISVGLSDSPGRACYHAKICVHDAKDKCGIDSKGTVRRFLDSCDIKEYNCLKGTDFVKTNEEKCKSLPLMDVKEIKGKQSLSNEISKTDVESMTLKSTTSGSKSQRGIKIIINTHAQQIGLNEENTTEEEQEEEEVEEEAKLDDEEVKSNEASKVNDNVDEDNNTDHDSLREEDNVSEASDALKVNTKDGDSEKQSLNGE